MTNFQCPKCGKEHVSLKQFCEYCGEDLDKYQKGASYTQISRRQAETRETRKYLIHGCSGTGFLGRMPLSIQLFIYGIAFLFVCFLIWVVYWVSKTG